MSEERDEDWNGLLPQDVSIRMTALDFALRHGGPKDFDYAEVVECAEAFAAFLTKDHA